MTDPKKPDAPKQVLWRASDTGAVQWAESSAAPRYEFANTNKVKSRQTFWPLTTTTPMPKRAVVQTPKRNSSLVWTMRIQFADGDTPKGTTLEWDCVTCKAHITDEAEADAHGCPPVQWRGAMDFR